jgi:hypothetical protein
MKKKEIPFELKEEIVIELINNKMCGENFKKSIVEKYDKTPDHIDGLCSSFRCAVENLQGIKSKKEGRIYLATQEIFAGTFDENDYRKKKQWYGQVEYLDVSYKVMKKYGALPEPNINKKNCGYTPSEVDYEYALRQLATAGQEIPISIIEDQIEKNMAEKSIILTGAESIGRICIH